MALALLGGSADASGTVLPSSLGIGLIGVAVDGTVLAGTPAADGRTACGRMDAASPRRPWPTGNVRRCRTRYCPWNRSGSLRTVSRPARIIDLEPLGGFVLRLTFSDGLVREFDLDGVLRGGIFDSLRDPTEFARVGVDEAAGTVSWPNGIDLDPDVLHGDHPPAAGSVPTVLREYTLRQTG